MAYQDAEKRRATTRERVRRFRARGDVTLVTPISGGLSVTPGYGPEPLTRRGYRVAGKALALIETELDEGKGNPHKAFIAGRDAIALTDLSLKLPPVVQQQAQTLIINIVVNKGPDAI